MADSCKVKYEIFCRQFIDTLANQQFIVYKIDEFTFCAKQD